MPEFTDVLRRCVEVARSASRNIRGSSFDQHDVSMLVRSTRPPVEWAQPANGGDSQKILGRSPSDKPGYRQNASKTHSLTSLLPRNEPRRPISHREPSNRALCGAGTLRSHTQSPIWRAGRMPDRGVS
jgi:hypothetical protein